VKKSSTLTSVHCLQTNKNAQMGYINTQICSVLIRDAAKDYKNSFAE